MKTQTEIEWTNDTAAEQAMKDCACTWTEQTIELSQIDFDQSSRNHARGDKAIHDDIVDDYSVAMQRGDVFPMLVTIKLPSGKYLILGGNHRALAAKTSGASSLRCYVVKPGSGQDFKELTDVLPRLLNRRHGLRQNREEALRNAIWMVNAKSKSPDKAAELFGLGIDFLRDELRANRVRDLLQINGVRVTGMPKTTLLKVHGIPNESVMVSAGRVISNSRMTGNEAAVFVSNINKARRSEAAQMAVVSEYESRISPNGDAPLPEPQKTKRNPPRDRTKFLIAISTIERLIKGKRYLKQFGITHEEEKQTQKKRLKEIAQKLHTLSNS